MTQYKMAKKGRMVNMLSKAATALIVVDIPLKEPRLHAGDAVGQQAIIGGYLDEIIEGTKDFYVEEGKWHYTYHQRLMNYKPPALPPIDQMDRILKGLMEGDLFSRRLQAVTWQAWVDGESANPPCLQRLWITVPTADSEKKPGRRYRVNLQSCWRSRDLFDAWSANVNALIELCRRKIVEPLNEAFQNRRIKFEVGRYVDFSNDLHIYEKDFKEVEKFLKTLKKKKTLGERPEKRRKGVSFDVLVRLGKR